MTQATQDMGDVAPRNGAKSALVLFLKIAVSVGLIALVLSKIDVGALKDRLLSPSLLPLAAVFALAIAQIGIVTWRFGRVLAVIERPIGFGQALSINLIGLFFNQSLPSTIGGDAMRVWRLVGMGVPLVTAAMGVVLDRITALIGILLLIAATLPALFWVVDDQTPIIACAVVVGIGLAGLGLALVLRRLPSVLMRWRMARGVNQLLADLRRIVLRVRIAVPVLGAAILGHLLATAIVYGLAVAYNVPVGYLECLLLVSPVMLIAIIPVSIAGWGVREGAMVAAFGLVGVVAGDALVLSVAFGLVSIIVGIPGGLVFLATNGKNRKT